MEGIRLYKEKCGGYTGRKIGTPEEVDLTKDLKDWEKLTDNERYFIKNILAFFAGSDGILLENLAARFMREVQIAEARQFYSVQLMMEAIHSETYSLLIDTYIEDKDEKLHLFKATQTTAIVTGKQIGRAHV